MTDAPLPIRITAVLVAGGALLAGGCRSDAHVQSSAMADAAAERSAPRLRALEHFLATMPGLDQPSLEESKIGTDGFEVLGGDEPHTIVMGRGRHDSMIGTYVMGADLATFADGR